MHDLKKIKKDDLQKLLQKHHLKITPLRLSLVTILTQAKKPMSADEISKKLLDTTFDRATLFRNLKTFVENQLCDVVDLGEGFHRFELHHDSHHSHHIQCIECKKIEEVHFCVPKEIEQTLEKQGYTKITHRMDFFGLCKKCSPK